MTDCKWEVGKTYKTTLPGVTATITKIDSGGVWGHGSQDFSSYPWHWSADTGRVAINPSDTRIPHLTTELADEPTERLEVDFRVSDEKPIESPRFTVVRRGEKWGVADLQRPGMHAPFGTHTSACRACEEMANAGCDCSYGFVKDDPSEADIEAVLSDPVVSDDGIDQHDAINNPPHYTQGAIECIDAIESALSPEEFRGFLRANVMKYVWRSKHKGGIEDLRKAEWYLKRLIAKEGGEA